MKFVMEGEKQWLAKVWKVWRFHFIPFSFRIILEADPMAVVQRVALKGDDIPLGEQTVAQVIQTAKDQLKWSLLRWNDQTVFFLMIFFGLWSTNHILVVFNINTHTIDQPTGHFRTILSGEINFILHLCTHFAQSFGKYAEKSFQYDSLSCPLTIAQHTLYTFFSFHF